MGFAATLAAARDAVTAADLTCVLDPRDITTLPAVWIRLDVLKDPTLESQASIMGVTVFCIVSPLDAERELVALEPFLAAAAAVIPPMTDPQMVAVLLPGGGTPAPALSYTHDLTID